MRPFIGRFVFFVDFMACVWYNNRNGKMGEFTLSIKKSIAGAVGGVMVVTLLCRVLALLANQMYMAQFGTADVQLNIYSYAISIPNVIFNSVGTAISTVVIPIYASLTAKKKLGEANVFASNVLTIFGSIILGLIVLGMGLAPILPKFTEFSSGADYAYAVKALMIMMPVMLFYGVSYVFQGVLQSLGKYTMPAAVSLPSSLIIIAYVLLFADQYGVTGLLWTTFLGLLLQALILIPPTVKAGFRFRWTYQLKDTHMKQAFSLILPVLIGSGAFQINMLYSNTLMANFEGTVTIMMFVQNIIVSSVLAVAYSVTAVLYPKMSQELAVGNTEGYKSVLTGGISTFIFLFLPATVGMILVRTPFMNLISGYGKVTAQDVEKAGMILALYAICLTSIALKELLDRGFYAAKNTKIPAVCGFITMGANVLFSQIAIRFLGPLGIPLAYSLASFCAMGFLFIKMRKQIGTFGNQTGKVFWTSLGAAVIMAVGVWLTMQYLPQFDGFIGRVIALGVPAGVGILLYAVVGILLKNPLIMKVLKR